MKNLNFLSSRSGMSPEVTCRKGRYCLDPILSRFSLVSLICVFMLTVGSGNVWGAEGDTHDFSQTLSQVLNNGVSIADVTVAEQTYTVKEVKVTVNYNKSKPGATVSVKVGGVTFGSAQTINSSTTTTFTFTGASAVKGQVVVSSTNNCTSSSGNGTFKITNVRLVEGASAGCSNSVALSKGTATNGTVNTISSASVATCSATASDRRVTVTITPADCFDAPSTLTWTKSSGTVSASKQSGPTDNGNGTYSYVYQFAQNNNGAGTFGVTCTAKAAGKTVNFNAGPGSCGTSSLTETCDGSGVTLPAVTATGVCKGWTTFAGWATAAVSDSSTTSVTVYAAGSKFVPASNGQTLYAVYSKVKGGGGGASWVLSSSAPAVGDSIIVAYYTGSAYKYMKNSGADNGDLTVAAGVATPVANGKFKLVSGNSYGVSLENGSNYLHLNSSAINVTTARTNGDLNISAGGSTNSFIIKRHSGATTYDRVLKWTGSNWTSTATMGDACEVYFFKRTTSTTYYCSDPNCCSDPGLAYGTGSVTKTYGNDPFTNPLTNSHSVAVTYALSSVSPAGCVSINASTGQVTINGAGSATVTASFAGNATYCADEASYTLTVNKANISPTLTYTPNSVAVGSNTSAPTVGGNPGSGGVTYAITSATPPGCATINTSTGVVTGVAVGSVTVTATVAATDNYNGNTATATVSIIAASYFQNGATVFIQADSKDYSAWKDDACVKAWFNASGAGGAAQTTYWLFDATDTDAGKKLFAAVVPASGNLNQVTVQRFAEGCGSFWNDNGTLTQASSGGVNTLHSYGSADNNIAWNGSSTTLSLYGSQNSWASSLATFTDQGSGVWTASFNNYAPDATSKDYKIKTSYNNGWIGNTGSNNNATLSGMIVGSTYNVTATLNVTTHALTMSKTFVKGEVSFDLQGHGSSIADLTNITAGSKISAPGTPSATGYDFGGWYKEPACTNAWDFANDVVNETMTLYAKWTKHTYTITSTLNNCSSSPAIPSSYEYTGSAASLSYTITPSSGYRLPTTITVSGTTYTWNSTTGALVLTGTIASNVTITISAVQTHTVDWYVGGSAPANKIDDDGQTTVVDHGGKIEDFPATTPDGSACDKTFVGWTNTTSYVHGTSPLFNDVAGSPTINADASFYAVFATGGTDYELVTSSSTALAAGDEIIFVSSATAGSAYAMGYQNTNNRPQVSVTIASGPKITSPTLATSTSDNTNIYPFILEANDGAFAIKENITGGRYLKADGAGSSGNNYLHSASETTPNTTTEKFTISIASSTSIATITGGNTANNARNVMQYNSGSSIFSCYASASQSSVYIYRKGYSGHTIICSDCGTSVTPTYTASPTGGTVSVTKSATPVTSGSTVKTCTAVDLTVTINPASHYTLTGFTATGLSTGTATISPVVAETLPKTTETTFTVTVSAGATGTLNLTPTFTEDAHKVISWVVHGSSASIADGHGTTWVYSGEDLTAIPTAPDAPTGCDDKVFVGWSENDGGATEEDASYYDDLFTTLVGAPTGITTDKTFTAVFATPAAGLGGTVMWDEPWTGASANDQPSGTTGYNSTSITYSYSADGCKIYEANLAGGTSPELLVKEKGESFTAANIPTAAQTALTLTYKSNKSLSISSGTSGVTVGDANVDGTTYTHTITISQSPAVNNFALTFTKTGSSNARIDDINIAVPGSSSMTGYVTTCEDTWTVTYYKNTEDAVTNLPSPTGISKSTGSGTLSSKVPVRYGYTFDGWAISAGGSVAYAAGAAVSSVSADMDLYAKWSVTPVTEINLSKTSLDKYVGDPSVILSVLSVLPDGANTSVTWSSSNPSVATVNSTTGEVNFVAEGTANIIATSTITSGITATCAVTVWAKPSVSFLDNLHSLTEDKDGNALSGYNITDVAGTPVVFPVLANQPAGSGTCEDEFYVFVGWTTSDNNTDPEDHLVTSHNLTNGDNITYYAVWANGVSGTTYTKLTSSTFKTSPTKYVLGAAHADSGTEHYFYSCDKTDKNNSWGYVTADLASNTPIEFTLSGTAAALVATSTEVSARYLKPLADKDFQMSASSQTVELKSDGTIYNNNTGDTSWRLLYNKAGGLRWYSSNVSGSTNAYFYEVVAGGEVNYRTSCCADKVAAPSVTATKTSTTVTLTWAAVSGATGYELQWNGGAWTAATSGVVKSDLTPNTNYSWRVRATYDPPKCGADIASGSTTTNQVYHVTYAKGSGTGSCNATGSTTDGTAYEAGATVTLQSNGFTLVGHTFNEWTEDDDDITISSNQFTMPEHDVVITATWTPKVDKFYDRMHDGTDASHGGIRDGDGKYYITREGCSYTVPSLTDNTSGATACHTKHYVLMGWTAENHLNSDGTLKTGHEGYVYTGGGTQTATGATYYAVWAEVEE